MANRPAVLLFEDNLGDVGLISAALEDCSTGVDLHTVSAVDRAIAFLQRRTPFESAPTPSLVITDFYRAERIAAKRLLDYLEEHRTPGMPIVVLTASADPRHREACAKPWVAEYCVKPCEWGGYQTLIARLVRRWVKRQAG